MARQIVGGALQERLHVVAIDFGTTFSGYAFSSKNDFMEDPLKIYTDRWSTGWNQSISMKTSTCILFESNKKFHSFGFDAEKKYAELAIDGQHEGWYFFKHFKMFLYDNKDLSRNTMLKDETGLKELQALMVFSESIKFMKHRFLVSCTFRQYGLNEDGIHWVLTVPAIWDDSSKQFMREAAIIAGIDSDHLSLALEPEAASMYCKHVPLTKIQGAKDGIACFMPGSRYMVIDAGGGILDITVHETQRDHTVRELYKANGGPWGGMSVDAAYQTFLTYISSPEAFMEFKLSYMEDYLDLMQEFEIKKYMTSPDMDKIITFNIPVTFHMSYARIYNEELRASRIVKESLKQNISFTRNKLRVQPEVVQGFFKEACERLVTHLRHIFKLREVHGTDTILMVGAFFESKMLQDAVRRNFSDKQLIIPAEAGHAVLKGAVIFGHNPTVITRRVSRLTYGVSTYNRFDTEKHPKQKFHMVEGRAYCSDIFDIHVNIEVEVEEGTTFQAKRYVPLHSGSKSMALNIYTCDRQNPRFTDDRGCQRLGCVQVDLSTIVLDSDKEVEVCMMYGGTELHVEAKVVKTGQKVKAEFEFL